MSGEPLKVKQSIPLHLVHEGTEDEKSKSNDNDRPGRILCAVSHTTITIQPTIGIKNTWQVMRKSVYKELSKHTMTCQFYAEEIQGKGCRGTDQVKEWVRGKWECDGQGVQSYLP